MAVQETNLGHFDYIGLYDKDSTKLQTGTNETYQWSWRVPSTINRRKSPSWFLSVVSCYCDDSTGGSAALPHFLRLNIPSENFHTYETTSPIIANPIVSFLVRDAAVGHWYSLSQDNVVIQVPSNIQYLTFDLLDGQGNVININNGANETLNIMLKITYPERTEVMANTTQTYAQSTVGNIRPFNTF